MNEEPQGSTHRSHHFRSRKYTQKLLVLYNLKKLLEKKQSYTPTDQ